MFRIQTHYLLNLENKFCLQPVFFFMTSCFGNKLMAFLTPTLYIHQYFLLSSVSILFSLLYVSLTYLNLKFLCCV